MRRWILWPLVGTLFGLGLVLSGMTRPDKVLAFLTLNSSWDPSLAFVMGGAIGVHFLAYLLVPRMKGPLLDSEFHIPTRKDIDLRLIGGAAMFGVGWGLSGYCPGPMFTSIAGGGVGALVVLTGLVAGMALFHVVDQRRTTGS